MVANLEKIEFKLLKQRNLTRLATCTVNLINKDKKFNEGLQGNKPMKKQWRNS